jgi:hypothetical protein
MDTVGYQVIRVREDIVVMSWQEHIGTYVTPEKGGFLQLSGTLRSRSVEMA